MDGLSVLDDMAASFEAEKAKERATEALVAGVVDEVRDTFAC